jgi:hypothetical protein
MITRFARASFLALLTAAPATLAQPRDPPPTPPSEAFEACASSRDGDACTVKLPDREIQGTCAPFHDAGLACRPNGPPPPPRR